MTHLARSLFLVTSFLLYSFHAVGSESDRTTLIFDEYNHVKEQHSTLGNYFSAKNDQKSVLFLKNKKLFSVKIPKLEKRGNFFVLKDRKNRNHKFKILKWKLILNKKVIVLSREKLNLKDIHQQWLATNRSVWLRDLFFSKVHAESTDETAGSSFAATALLSSIVTDFNITIPVGLQMQVHRSASGCQRQNLSILKNFNRMVKIEGSQVIGLTCSPFDHSQSTGRLEKIRIKLPEQPETKYRPKRPAREVEVVFDFNDTIQNNQNANNVVGAQVSSFNPQSGELLYSDTYKRFDQQGKYLGSNQRIKQANPVQVTPESRIYISQYRTYGDPTIPTLTNHSYRNSSNRPFTQDRAFSKNYDTQGNPVQSITGKLFAKEHDIFKTLQNEFLFQRLITSNRCCGPDYWDPLTLGNQNKCQQAIDNQYRCGQEDDIQQVEKDPEEGLSEI